MLGEKIISPKFAPRNFAQRNFRAPYPGETKVIQGATCSVLFTVALADGAGHTLASPNPLPRKGFEPQALPGVRTSPSRQQVGYAKCDPPRGYDSNPMETHMCTFLHHIA